MSPTPLRNAVRLGRRSMPGKGIRKRMRCVGQWGRVLFAEDVVVEETRSRKTLWNVLGVALLLGLVIGAWLYWQSPRFDLPAQFSDPLEATALVGSNDRLPALVSGEPPANPDPEALVVPTIVCRVLIDPEGRVQDCSTLRASAQWHGRIRRGSARRRQGLPVYPRYQAGQTRARVGFVDG